MKRGQRKRIDCIATPAPGQKARASKPGRLSRYDFNLSLEHAARHVGGLPGMIHLGRYCDDARIQRVVGIWDGLGDYERNRTTLTALCEATCVEPCVFLAKVVATAWDFNQNRLEDVARGIGGRPALARFSHHVARRSA